MKPLKRAVWICLTAGFLMLTSGCATRAVSAVSAAPYPGTHTVIIDAGHGGMDGGATGRSGTSEKDLNLQIALKTERILRFFGVPAVMTRRTDTALFSGDTTIREQKAEDLRRRRELAEAQAAPIYISIHQNFFGDLVSHGAQVFYYSTSETGKALAGIVHNALQTVVGGENVRPIAPNPNRNYLLSHLTCPAVIVECGFLSHPEEEMRLCDPAYQAKLAFAVAVSAMSFDAPTQ